MLFHRWKLVYTESSDFTKLSSPFIPSLPCTSCLPLVVISTSQVYIMTGDWLRGEIFPLSIPINSILGGMNIHKSELFFDVNKRGNKVLTHPHILFIMFYQIDLVLGTWKVRCPGSMNGLVEVENHQKENMVLVYVQWFVVICSGIWLGSSEMEVPSTLW